MRRLLLLFSASEASELAAAVRAAHAELARRIGDEAAHVVSADDVLLATTIAIAPCHQATARRCIGAEAWQRCRVALRAADYPEARLPTGRRRRGILARAAGAIRAIAGRRRPASKPWALPVRRRTIRQKAIAFIEAVTGQGAGEDTYQARLAICRSNECGHLIESDGGYYCGACGCGKWRLAELLRKLRFGDLECPCDPPLWGRAEAAAANTQHPRGGQT